MVSKNNKKLIDEKNRQNTKQRFAIRKLNVGVASVLLGITFSIYGGGQVVAHADTTSDSEHVATTSNDEALADKSEVTLQAKSGDEEGSQPSATVSDGEKQSDSVAVEQQAAANESVETANTANKEQKVTLAADDSQTTASETPAVQADQTTSEATEENNDSSANADTETVDSDAVKSDESKSDETTQTLDVKGEKPATEAELNASAVAATADDQNEDTVDVDTADKLIDEIQNGTATTINITNDINLGTKTSTQYTGTPIKNKRNIVIQATENRKTVDFAGYGFNMYSNEYGVTFKNLDLYGQSYYGIVRSAGSYTFDNVDYTGSQMVYTDPGYSTTVTFIGDVNATSVGSYTGPLDEKTRKSQGGNTQQVLQFANGSNAINFEAGSKVSLTTTNSNVIEIDKGTTQINVKSNEDGTNGAQVTLNPHTQNGPEQLNGMKMDRIARGIASNGQTTLEIDKGAILNINLKDNAEDKYHSSALFLNSGATINNNGNLNIISEGKPFYVASGIDDPIYINSNATINVGNGGSLNLTATGLDNFQGHLMTVSGNAAVNLAPHSTFKITGDGTGALTAINLSSGSTFTSDQPKEFTIDLSANNNSGKALIKNGTINFTRVKNTNVDKAFQVSLGEVTVTYTNTGTLSSMKLTGEGQPAKNALKAIHTYIQNNPSKLSFVAAGEDVTLSDVHLSKDNKLTGIALSSGDSTNPIHIVVKINGEMVSLPSDNTYLMLTLAGDASERSKVKDNGSLKNNGGEFTIDLSSVADKLTPDAKISVVATKDFVNSPTVEKTIEDLRSIDTATLKDLVEAAPTERKNASYFNATDGAKSAYDNAVEAGKTILDNISNNAATYDQSDIDAAVTAIQTAKNALNGEATDKTALQTAVSESTTTKSSENYTNADADKQQAYDAAITAGQEVLNNANATQKQVNDALTVINNAKDALNGDAKKNAASKEALQQAVKEAPTVRTENSAYYNGTDDAKKAYDDAVKAGQEALDNEDATATDITNALNAINTAKSNLDGKATVKDELQKAVDDSSDVQKSADYTSSSKEVKDAYDSAISEAKTVLDNSNATQAQVDEAKQKIADAQSKLNGVSNLKDSAKGEIQTALDKKLNEIKNATNIDQATKDQLTSDAKKAADAANTAIDNATDANGIDSAKNTGITNINNVKVPSLEDAKTAAKQVVDNALTKKLDEITTNKNLTDEEKAKLTNDANTAATKAKAKIDATTTNDDATQAGQDGKTAIEAVNVPADSDAKKAAKDAIDAAAKAKNDLIDSSDLTDEEKNDLKKQVADAVKVAKDNIDAATKDAEVSTAQTNGEKAIDAVEIPASTSKTEAINAINKALDDKKTVINGTDLTDEEKDALVEQAQKLADTAITKVNEATTNDGVTVAKENGVQSIKNMNIPENSTAKQKAEASIDAAAEAAKKAIDNTNGLTDSEKQAAKNQVDVDATAAKDAIKNAKTNNDVDEAVNNGTVAINKDAANAAIDGALAEKNSTIDAAEYLTDEEKQVVKKQAKTAADNAKTEINKATTVDEVESAKDTGIDNINKVVVSTDSQVKNDAIAAIDQVLKQKTDAINAAEYLTDEEKKSLTDQATTAANNAKTAINAAQNNDAVKKAQNDGIDAINKVTVPDTSAVKDAAKQVVENAANAKRDAINKASNLTRDEKQEIINQVDTAEEAAKKAIDGASTTKAVTDAQTAGVDTISKITIPTDSKVKEDAVAEINTALKNKLDEIDKATKLTSDERNTLITKANDAANAAKKAIDDADTNAAVADAKNAGITAIDQIEVSTDSKVKQNAKDAVKQAADTKIDKINSVSGLTSDEKDALIKQVNDIVTQTNSNIDDAPTNEAVETAKNTGISSIEGIAIPSTSPAKDQANNDIDKAAEDAKKAVDETPGLTDEQKQAAKNQIDQDAKIAKDNINNATSDEDVKKTTDDGIVAIDKNAAKAAVDGAAAVKNNEINNSNLTDEEKQALTDRVNEEAKGAKDKIDSASTKDEIDTAKNEGLKKIDEIVIPTDSKVKDAAIAEITAELNKKLDEINSNLALVEEEKNTLISEANSAADKAKEAVRNATSDSDVENEKNTGITNIRNVNVPTESKTKQDAKAAIDAAAAAKKDEISKASLTNDEAKKLNDLVDQEAASAKNAIDAAKTNAAVNNAKGAGVKSINSIKVPVRVVNVINYVDENGNIVKTDSVSGELGEKISLNAPAGYHFKDGKTPSLVITQNGVQTVNVVKDQDNTDTPGTNDELALNVINYVDENGNIIKSDSVSGKIGDAVKVALPAGYHFKDSQTPILVISKDTPVQTINVVKDQVTPEEPTTDDNKNSNTPTVDDDNKKDEASTVDNGAAASNTGVQAENSKNTTASAVSSATTKAVANNNEQGQLPQTGNENNAMSAAGLALAGLAGLFGLSSIKKKRD